MSATRAVLACALLVLPLTSPVRGADPPAAATTLDAVLGLLLRDTPEADIRAALEKSPTQFVIGAKEETALKKAGASAELIAFMKQARGTPVKLLTDLAVILDCSGSMSDKTTGGETKMAVAKRVVSDLVGKLPENLRVTFVIYGHNVEEKCEAVKVVYPLQELTDAGRSELRAAIAGLQPTGHTPIANSLKAAGKELATRRDAACGLVLITDGIETCHGDPAAEAAKLAKDLNLTFGVNVVGFELNEQESRAVEEIAKKGKGKYYPAKGADELQKAVAEVLSSVPEPPAPAGPARRRQVIVHDVRELKLPALDAIKVYEAGTHFGAVAPTPVVVGRYGEPIRIPSSGKYDVYWVPKEGKQVLLAKDFSIAEPLEKPVELKLSELVGVVFVRGDGQPKAKQVFLRQGERTAVWHVDQFTNGYNKPLVIRAGAYNVGVIRADNGREELLEKHFEVKAGKVSMVE